MSQDSNLRDSSIDGNSNICSECEKSFASQFSLRRHRRQVHQAQESESEVDTESNNTGSESNHDTEMDGRSESDGDTESEADSELYESFNDLYDLKMEEAFDDVVPNIMDNDDNYDENKLRIVVSNYLPTIRERFRNSLIDMFILYKGMKEDRKFVPLFDQIDKYADKGYDLTDNVRISVRRFKHKFDDDMNDFVQNLSECESDESDDDGDETESDDVAMDKYGQLYNNMIQDTFCELQDSQNDSSNENDGQTELMDGENSTEDVLPIMRKKFREKIIDMITFVKMMTKIDKFKPLFTKISKYEEKDEDFDDAIERAVERNKHLFDKDIANYADIYLKALVEDSAGDGTG